MTENQKEPPPLHILRSRGAHTQLSLATSMRGNVANHLLGKPPNPRRGTSWKRRQTSLFTHTQLSLAIFKGEMWQPKGSYWGDREAKNGRTKDKEGYINFGKISNFAKV